LKIQLKDETLEALRVIVTIRVKLKHVVKCCCLWGGEICGTWTHSATIVDAALKRRRAAGDSESIEFYDTRAHSKRFYWFSFWIL